MGLSRSSEALSGLRVVEFASYLPGALCSLYLHRLGADVVKIEPPGGDPYRGFGPRDPAGEPAAFGLVNQGKRLMSADVKTPAGLSAVLDVATGADVFIDGYRPGVAPRLGLSFDDLRTVSPAVVYCSISGFGQTGPRRDQTGHDGTYGALTGVTAATRLAGSGQPVRPGLHVGDHLAALTAALSITAVLRSEPRRAQYIDASITDALLGAQAPQLADAIFGDGDIVEHSSPENDIYRCGDGRYLAVAAVEPHYWVALCETLGLSDLAADESLRSVAARRERRQEIAPLIAGELARLGRDHWVAVLGRRAVPCAPVLTLGDALADDHFVQREMVTRVDESPGWRVEFPAVFGAAGEPEISPPTGRNNSDKEYP